MLRCCLSKLALIHFKRTLEVERFLLGSLSWHCDDSQLVLEIHYAHLLPFIPPPAFHLLLQLMLQPSSLVGSVIEGGYCYGCFTGQKQSLMAPPQRSLTSSITSFNLPTCLPVPSHSPQVPSLPKSAYLSSMKRYHFLSLNGQSGNSAAVCISSF